MKKTASYLIATLMAGCAMPAMAQTADTPSAPDIVVTGMRASLQSAATIKRKASEIVDSITATDIGKLPDINVSETLTRVPGVQAYRFGGEAASPVGVGSGVTVRGLTGQTASRVDGRAYFTASQRDFNLEGVMPAIVAGMDVYKNPSAEHIEGGIGGVVNIRTRRPLDFKGLTITASVGAKYNDLAQQARPDVFGMIANRWTVGDGELGIMIAGGVSQTINRGDNTPGATGVQFRRAIAANSAEYAAGAASGLYNSAYTGRSDVNYLAAVNPATYTGDKSQLISVFGQNPTWGYERYVRTRRGLNAAVQFKASPDLEFYAEGLYNFYQYHQDYGFLNPNNSSYVRGMTTTPFAVNEGLANRNVNGGSDDLMSGQLLTGGTFLGSSFSVNTGSNKNDYTTAIIATGVNWNAGDHLAVSVDLSYMSAKRKLFGRSLTFLPAQGASWDIARNLAAQPSYMTVGGPDLASRSSWVYGQFGAFPQTSDDDGVAAKVDFTRKFDEGFLKSVKVGFRYGTQNDTFRDYTTSGKNLTTNGAALTSDYSNAISVANVGNTFGNVPTNFMGGASGYPGGWLIFDPNNLWGNTVAQAFPQAGIPNEGAYAEVVSNRRIFREKTYAAYAVGNFELLAGKVTGSAGVRFVRTNTFTQAQVSTSGGLVPNSVSGGYTNVLPSINVTGHLDDKTQLRLGYGKGLTRPSPDALNPSIVVSDAQGTASVGNPNLKPQTGDSFDISLEHYAGRSAYASIGLFYKRIEGFFSQINQCETVPSFTYSGAIINGCSAGQYLVTRTVNAQTGSAKGVELAAQTFFDYDFVPKALRKFGASGSFTYVDTKNPVLLSNGILVNSVQPFTSKFNYTLTGMYEDDKMSARLVYTYRSKAEFNAIGVNPVDSRYITGFGLLDASFTVNLPASLQLVLTASNLTNAVPNRFYGEPGYYTGIERQHYLNGRNYSVSLRWKFGG